MFSKAAKQEFWTVFGKYMSPVPGAEGDPVNWVNYRTGVRHISFRMDANEHRAIITIEFRGDFAEEYFARFEAMKMLFNEEAGEGWNWSHNDGRGLPTISNTLPGSNVYSQQEWPSIISFFKEKIMSLDRFWVNAKPYFE